MTSLSEHLSLGLSPLGFKLESQFGGLNYTANIEGHQIKVHCSSRTKTKYAGEIRYQQYVGHRLEISVETTVKTRLTVSKELNFMSQKIAQFLNQKIGSQRVTGLTPFYAVLQVWASDIAWARSFLNLDGIVTVMTGLFSHQPNSPLIISVKLAPESVILYQQILGQEITASKLKYWVEATLYIAKMAERSPPLTVVELSWVERQIKEHPVGSAIGIIIGLFAILIFLSLLFVGLLLLFVFLQS